MNIKRLFAVAGLAGVAMVAAVACQGAVPAAQPSDVPPNSQTPTTLEPSEPPSIPTSSLPPKASPDASEIVMAEVRAPIESVKINIAESFPPQYFVAIMSGLPSGCAKFNDYEVSRDGNTVSIEVTNLQPAEGQMIACTAIYGYHDSNINLGTDFVGGERYTVKVNDSVTETFVAQESGIEAGDETGGRISEPAPIDDLRIDVNTLTGDSELVVRSGLPNSCYEFGKASLVYDGDTIHLDISNLRLADQSIMCAELYRTVETRLALKTSVEPCETYTVLANGNEYSVQAIAPNVRCADHGPVGQPLPNEPDYSTVSVPAPIESVMIISTRSLPPQYVVKIISGLPSGCAQFFDYNMVRDGDDIRISVTNLVPSPETLVMCTQIYAYHDTSINIGSDFERGVKYSVRVNDFPAETFVGVGGPDRSKSGLDIPLGESVKVEDQSLVLEFTEVTADSRCPANVVCVWAGEAKILLSATAQREDLGEHDLVLDPTGASSNSATIDGRVVTLVALNPYPGTSGSSASPDYVATLTVWEPAVSEEPSSVPAATVWAEAIPNEPRTVALHAEIVGGADNDKSLYCLGTEWQFGDGNGMASIASCLPWTPASTIQRDFEATYTYDASGTYEVKFTYGTVVATSIIEVK
jgi:hypothetical protein